MIGKPNPYERLHRTSLMSTPSFFRELMMAGRPFNVQSLKETDWSPATNINEYDTYFEIELSIPGYTKKDIQVDLSNKLLRISGERKEEFAKEEETYRRREFEYGSFTRVFHLPESVKDNAISAKCMNGVLTITLPKLETAILKEKVKEIEIS